MSKKKRRISITQQIMNELIKIQNGKDDAKPEKIWVRLTDYIINPLTHEKFFEGSLLNSPFDKNYNLSEGDSVYLSIVDCVGKKLLLIIPKPTE